MQPDRYTRTISKAFGDHAKEYDENSSIQKRIAETLITYCPDFDHAPRILEIGCGTGHLTHLLLGKYNNADFVITDINSDMRDVCIGKCGNGAHTQDVEYHAMNGEYLDPNLGKFDLIVSGMTVQWFQDTECSVEKWKNFLSDNGQIHLSTLGDGYFSEWRDAMMRSNVKSRLLLSPSLPKDMQTQMLTLTENYKNAVGFLRHLKGTGASTSLPNTGFLTTKELMRVIKSYDEKYRGEMTWKIAIGSWTP
ncbi:MAG: methyltransferase domain-containing protein [Alphaproteobacteria bacterium]|nr:methyltransferase domain-containing protein [Alphaproteobacteria bacterium]